MHPSSGMTVLISESVEHRLLLGPYKLTAI